MPGLARPGGHEKHAACSLVLPVVLPYLPAAHRVQLGLAAVDEYRPASQAAHAEDDEEPGLGFERPAGHAEHVLLDVAPLALLYRPAVHCVHEPAPCWDQVPGTHGEHWFSLVAPVCGREYPAGHSVHLNASDLPL